MDYPVNANKLMENYRKMSGDVPNEVVKQLFEAHISDVNVAYMAGLLEGERRAKERLHE